MKRVLLVVVDLTVICSVLVILAALGLAVKGAPATTPNVSTPIAFSYSEVNAKLEPMTGAQRSAYISSLVGTRVRVSGIVRDVPNTAQINLSVDGCYACVFLLNAPPQVLQSLNRNQPVTAIGTVNGLSSYPGQLNLFLSFESINP